MYALDRTSILEKAQKEGGKEEGTLEMGREWKLFGEEGGEREEVCCGVYCDFTKEAWLGTSEGYVWRKGKSKSGLMERKEVGGGGVTAMAIVGNQVFYLFEIPFFFFFFSFFSLSFKFLFVWVCLLLIDFFCLDMVWNDIWCHSPIWSVFLWFSLRRKRRRERSQPPHSHH